MTPNLIQVTPFLHVPAFEPALAFFTETLGFAVTFRMGTYAYVEREGVAFRLMEDSPDEISVGPRRFAHYVDVRDVDALYAELKPKLDLMPDGDVVGPRDQPYGQRELMILAPDGQVLVFGQAIGG